MDLFDKFSISVQDRTALKVAKHMEFDEEEDYSTRDRDDISRSAIGELSRRSNNEIINTFPEGHQLVEKFQ